jgi:hypothetical protein
LPRWGSPSAVDQLVAALPVDAVGTADVILQLLESGRPCWVKPDEVWFSWAFAWEEIASRHECVPGERTRIRDMLIERMKVKDMPHKRYRFASGRRADFVSFTSPWLETVQRLTAGGDEVVEDGV